MAKQLQLRRGTTSQHSSFTGLVGEVTVDTDKDTAVVHDGSTAGGKPLATEALAAPKASPTFTGTVAGVTKAHVGLSNVDNTADASQTSVGTVATGTWAATDVAVAHGGTGASTLTDGGVLLGSGTGAITAMAVLADGAMIVGDGTTDPVAESGGTLRTSIGLGSVTDESKATMFASPTFTGATKFTGGIVEKVGTSSVSGTTVTVDLATGNFFAMDLEGLSGNVVTFTISNINATANQLSNFIVKITQGTTTTTRNFTWATIVSNGTNIDWAGGAGPDITTGNDKIDILSFTSYDNGTTWYGALVGQEFG